MQAVLNRTLDYAKARTKEGEKPSARDMELKLIQSKRDIEEPRVTAKAEVIAKKA
jgi:pyridoxine kinase